MGPDSLIIFNGLSWYTTEPAPLSEGWAVMQLILYSMGLINNPFFRLFTVCLMESCRAVFLDNVEDN